MDRVKTYLENNYPKAVNHPELKEEELFIGNGTTKDAETLTHNGITVRMGITAYNIEGNPLENWPDIKPLFIPMDMKDKYEKLRRKNL